MVSRKDKSSLYSLAPQKQCCFRSLPQARGFSVRRMLAEQRSTTYPSQIRVKRRFLVLLAYLQNRDELSAMLFSKAFVGSRSYAYLGRMR